jgi:hypothetical protein
MQQNQCIHTSTVFFFLLEAEHFLGEDSFYEVSHLKANFIVALDHQITLLTPDMIKIYGYMCDQFF